MSRRAVTGDAPVMVADECGVGSHMRDTSLLPELEFAPPVLFGPGARGHPHLDAHVFRISTRFAHQRAQLFKRRQRRLARRKVEWHDRGLIPASSMRWNSPVKATWSCPHNACMTWTCSPERLPRL